MDPTYYISTQRLRDLIVSVEEVRDAEVIGTLTGDVGRRNLYDQYRRVAYVNGVYPFQCALRRESIVKVPKRTVRRQVIALRNLGARVLGGYHSHTRSLNTKTSPDDFQFAETMMEIFNYDHWFEMIAAPIIGETPKNGAPTRVIMNGMGPDFYHVNDDGDLTYMRIRGHVFYRDRNRIRKRQCYVYSPEREWL